MKHRRYAAHYLRLPDSHFLRQHVVEVENGCVVRMFPLNEEIEDVEWLPGLIALETSNEDGVPIPYYYYPFDFTLMQPVAGTQRRQLP
ncbi:hypothetical protein [uncultured Bacteroides sp.]|uniref:hypothetical protein n=1 Tax=uncultured Bacteroides sp. TaxID=162156 RepID=UPI0026114408|nr:hypothetical protein [uncultured Bacteroides sp.]